MWVAIVEAPFALFGCWVAYQVVVTLLGEARKGMREAACARAGGHALKPTRWYCCRACGYEASPEEARTEMEKEKADGAKFVILRPMGGE
jgi:hypothetical protein